MKLLFIHQNFPGQFKHLAPALVQEGHQVVALILRQGEPMVWQGIRVIPYMPARSSTPNIHPWLVDFETKTIRAEACFQACLALRQQGFVPDAIVAHPGWGETLFIKEVWPKARLGIYCEFYYAPEGTDVGFDAEFPSQESAEACRIAMKNLNNRLHFDIADAGISPTHWQASTFPEPFRGRITVVHDGIDTASLVPNPGVSLSFDRSKTVLPLPEPGVGPLTLTRADRVVTFVNRNLEPYRGYHSFMRALPELLRLQPTAQILIVGGNDVSYGPRPDPALGGNWRDIFAREARAGISPADWQRVHFLGALPYEHFVPLLQLSSVHVYLTYPFVLSWSLLEAMSIGCATVASDTPPLREAITDHHTGRLVDFFSPQQIAQTVSDLLDRPDTREELGSHARAFAVDHYDLQSVCLARQLDWVHALAQQ